MLRLVTVAVVAVAIAVSVYLGTRQTTTPPASTTLQVGLVSNSDPQPATIARLGASIVRVEFPIDETPAQLAPVISEFARLGVRVLPLAGFVGRVPTISEARNVAGWAHEFGPSGGFWRNHAGGDLPIQDIEFGNETNQAGQFEGCGAGCSSFAQRARSYALALKAAQEAVDGPLGNNRVGLLAIGDDAGTESPEWVNSMFEAVPDLAHRIAGWTAHPYGPNWQPLLDRLVSQTAARGAPASIPIFITEVGIASDNGSCLGDNFGWNPCMTYREAATALKATIVGIRARYGKRVKAILIYQAFDQRPPGADNSREHYLGALTAEGAVKGDYTAAISSLLRTMR
jgi:hypothetical protein